MTEDSKYKKAFIDESRDNLQDMNIALLDLEKDPGRRELIDEMFRHAHTIKGGAASMDYEDISTLAHEMESLMDRLRSQNIEPDSSVTDILYETLDLLEALVEGVAKQEKQEIDITPLIDRLNAVILTGPPLKPEAAEEVPAPAEPGKDTLIKGKYNFQINVKIREDCVFKSIRAMMVLKNLEKIGEIESTVPEVRDIEDEKFDRSISVFLTTKENEEAILKVVGSVSEIETVDVLPVSRPSLPSTKVPVSSKAKAQTVRVDIGRLDKLMDLVGELVIDKARLIRIDSMHEISELSETVAHLDRLISDIQEEVMQARLVPVDMIFNRFPRMVRDLAKAGDKKIDLTMEGTEIEVDRTILDKISDPLIHVLRNAVDHAIESAAERKSAGKPEAGSVKLAASRERAHVFVEVTDDGKGMDPDDILKKALEKGAVTPEDAAKLNDQEKLMLICVPGFSTAETVTVVSGRGVGMDVVKSTLESLGGTLVIDSKKGQGSKFTLQLPLTMAIARSLLITVQQEIFAVPLANVQEIVRVMAEDVKTAKGEEVIILRGRVIPLIRLDKKLGLSSSQEKKSEFNALVVEVGNKRAGFVVDALLGQQEIVIKSLDAHLKKVKGYAGATILGDGRPAFILDVPSLLS